MEQRRFLSAFSLKAFPGREKEAPVLFRLFLHRKRSRMEGRGRAGFVYCTQYVRGEFYTWNPEESFKSSPHYVKIFV